MAYREASCRDPSRTNDCLRGTDFMVHLWHSCRSKLAWEIVYCWGSICQHEGASGGDISNRWLGRCYTTHRVICNEMTSFAIASIESLILEKFMCRMLRAMVFCVKRLSSICKQHILVIAAHLSYLGTSICMKADPPQNFPKQCNLDDTSAFVEVPYSCFCST